MFQEVITLIQGVGFPIACCVVLFYEQKKLVLTLGDLSKTLEVMNTRLDCIEDCLHISHKKEEGT